MARLNANPIKSPLAGTEGGSLTDPTTGNDVGFTPLTITQFAQENMTIATGSTQGLIAGAQGDKLAGLPSDTQLQELLEVAFPFFVGAPSNGTQVIYTHLLAADWLFDLAYGAVSAGSTNLTVSINGTPVNGWNNVPVLGVGTSNTYVTSQDASCNLISGSSVSVTLAGTTGNCANLRFSMRAQASLP